MIRRLLSQFLSSFLLLGFVRRMKRKTSLMKIKVAQAYVHGVKKSRLFCLGALFLTISFVFLTNGLTLIQAAFFTYSSWSLQVKFIVSLVLGLLELLGASLILYFLFREETWVKFFCIQDVINSVIEDKPEKPAASSS